MRIEIRTYTIIRNKTRLKTKGRNYIFFDFIGVIRNFQILFASLIKFSIAVVFEVFSNHKNKNE